MRLLKRILLILPVLFLVFTCSDDDDPDKFILSVSITPKEGGSVSPEGGTFEDGTIVTLTATPSEGYVFREWMGDLKSTENPVSATMVRDMTITLVFVKSDEDNDGVPDDIDECLNTPAGEDVDETGCSASQIDSDRDGVSDDNDLCSNTPDGADVDENGCADSQKDTDGDGISDDLDVCPDTPEGEAVNADGCSNSQTDTDNDGVADDKDVCPDTPEGEEVDEQGCPLSPPVYLDENGITIKAYEWAQVGQTGEVNGVVYTIVDESSLRSMVDNGEDVTGVCTSKVTDMSALFFLDSRFNQDISSWDVSNVTDMSRMFVGDIMSGFRHPFNQDISHWDVSNVTDMSAMFSFSGFNKQIENWNVSSVTDMEGMFTFANFNQPIEGWDVSNVKDMSRMFLYATSFNQDLSGWNVENVELCEDFSVNTPQWTLPKPNFTNCNPN